MLRSIRFLILSLTLSFFHSPASAYSLEYMASKAIKSAFNAAQGFERNPSHVTESYVRMSVTQGTQNTECADLYPYGSPLMRSPTVNERGFFTCRIGYSGMYDPSTKTPRWIAERLDRNNIEGSANRKGIQFAEDPQIPWSKNARIDDYKGSGFDKGHLAPAADFRNSQSAMTQSFLLSNIIPQNSEQNRGVWTNLEAAVREIASRRGELYVITGPIYSQQSTMIGRGVVVPDALYKVLIDKRKGEMTGFIIPNRSGQGSDPSRFQVSVREVEKLTGVEFNPNLSRSDADRLELVGGNWLIPKIRVRFKD